VIARESLPAGLLRTYFGAADPPIEHWPDETLRAYQRDAVREQLAHVEANNPFYRQKFRQAGVSVADFRDLDDLGRFPFTAKDELRGDPWVLLSVPRDQVALAHTSTGTSGGAWSYVLYSWDDMHVHDQAPYPRLLMPVRDSDVVVNALPYEMSSSGQSFQRSLQGAAGALVVPVGKGGFYSDAHKTVQVMRELAADVLITTPPYAMALAEVAAAKGLRLGEDLRLRFMWITGEGCSPAYRKRLEALWHCPALVFYGSMECGSIAIECPEHAGSHVSLGHVYLEIVDPKSGRPLPPGQVGEVVCTVLQRKASPLVRFRTGDLGFLDPAPCRCGVCFPRMNLRGRIIEQVSAGADSAGTAVSPYLIEEVLYSHAEVGGNYQIYTAGDRVVIDAERTAAGGPAGAANWDAARDRIVQGLAERGVRAEVEWVDYLPRTGGKTRRVRPLADRGEVLAAPCVVRKETP
jgi:phenylacetate-CoA ligase